MPRHAATVALRSLVAVITLSFPAAAIDVNSLPAPTGYVNDLAQVLSPPEKAQLEELCREVDRQLGAQFAFLTVDTIGDGPIRDFGLEVGRKWGVGAKGTNAGLLMILSVQQHEDDIEVGRGLEPYVTDGFAGSVRRDMASDLRAGQYGPALLGAAQTLAQHVAEGKGVSFTFQGLQPRPRPRPARRDSGFPGWLIILGIFFVFWIIGRGGRRGGGGGGLGNFATGMLIGDLLGGGRRGGWGDGGGGGFGGDSGGGGGFGGFGGGDFGGGGASGNW